MGVGAADADGRRAERQSRRRLQDDVFAHPLDDAHWRARSPDWSRVDVPLFSSANWGGQGLHPRGNFEGFVRAKLRAEMAGGARDRALDTLLYGLWAAELQKRFFDHFLKGDDTSGWQEPKVRLQVRHPGERFVERCEADWPIPRTRWTKYHLDPAAFSLSTRTPRAQDTAVTVPRARRRADVPDAADAGSDRDHRPARRQIASRVLDAATPISFSSCGSSRPT